MFYQFLKGLHIISAVAWFAALFYLPRLFVYHALAQKEQETQSINRFLTMERKLYKLGHIAFGMLIISALLMNIENHFIVFKNGGWLHLKVFLVGLLFAYYIYCGKIYKNFKQGNNKKSARFYRYFNEIPAFFLIAIVLLATMKPF